MEPSEVRTPSNLASNRCNRGLGCIEEPLHIDYSAFFPKHLSDTAFGLDDVVSKLAMEKPDDQLLGVMLTLHQPPAGFLLKQAVVSVEGHATSSTCELVQRHVRAQRGLVVQLLEETKRRRQRRNAGCQLADEPLVQDLLVKSGTLPTTERKEGSCGRTPPPGKTSELITIRHGRTPRQSQVLMPKSHNQPDIVKTPAAECREFSGLGSRGLQEAPPLPPAQTCSGCLSTSELGQLRHGPRALGVGLPVQPPR